MLENATSVQPSLIGRITIAAIDCDRMGLYQLADALDQAIENIARSEAEEAKK
jgi:hypothetical protein